MEILLEKSKSGKKTLVFYKNRKRYPVYSIYDPERDGIRFYERYKIEGYDYYIFMGIGLCYHIAPFVKDRSIKKLIILEPELNLYQIVKDTESVKSVIKNPKVEVYVGHEVDDFVNDIKKRYDLLFFKGLKLLNYKHLKDIFSYDYKKIEDRIKVELDILLNDGLTIAKFSKLWINNFLNNISNIKTINLVSSLFDICKGRVLITGAGPSLDLRYNDIKASRKSFFIIATDASVKPLILNDIKPDLIVSVDPQPEVFYHFTGLDSKLIKNIPVVLNLFSYSGVFRLFKKRYIYFDYHPLNKIFDVDMITLLNYRSVSSLAFKLAVLMGFNDIYLAGYDFSYPWKRVYAKNSFFYEYAHVNSDRFYTILNFEGNILKKSDVKIKDRRGLPLYSSKKLIEYLEELENVINEAKLSSDIKVLNLGEYSCKIKGTEKIKKRFLESGYRLSIQGEKIVQLNIDYESIKKIEYDVVLTLGLRNRILKKIDERINALNEAKTFFNQKFKLYLQMHKV